MKLSIDVLIIGAGYSGLIFHAKLNKETQLKSFIVEKGYNHGYTGDDYVIFTKHKFWFSDEPIRVVTKKTSSGNKPFDIEYTNKLYNKKINISLFSDKDSLSEIDGYPISSEKLLENSKIYGNIEVLRIDIINKIVHGRILHLNKDVEISYGTLINTMSLHEFAKLINKNLFAEFGIFISYFPIGVKIMHSIENNPDMNIEYFSDPNIPFYRKQMYKNTIYYEYCINKPFNDRFNNVVIPGKFTKIDKNILINTHRYFIENSIYHIGRFSIWDPDFLLDHILIDDKTVSGCFVINKLYNHLGLKYND